MRDNLTGHVADRVRTMVVDGILPAGDRINEVDVARQLDVSRTPLREALYRLTTDGFVENRPRQGFFVARLEPDDARQLYEIRAILDPAALEVAGIPDDRGLGRLEALNEEIEESQGEVERTIDLDDAWHLELVSGCSNRVLLDLIRTFMLRTRPLERAYVRHHPAVGAMVAEHAEIVRRLRTGELDEAVAALRRNMSSGISPILRWLRRSHPDPSDMRRGGGR